MMFLQLLPEQAAMRLNHVAKTGVPATTSTNGDVEFPWPGFESEPLNREKIKMYILCTFPPLADCLTSAVKLLAWHTHIPVTFFCSLDVPLDQDV
jgi:hypothetical protein